MALSVSMTSVDIEGLNRILLTIDSILLRIDFGQVMS